MGSCGWGRWGCGTPLQPSSGWESPTCTPNDSTGIAGLPSDGLVPAIGRGVDAACCGGLFGCSAAMCGGYGGVPHTRLTGWYRQGCAWGGGDSFHDSRIRPTPRSSFCVGKGGLMGRVVRCGLGCTGCGVCGDVTRCVYVMSCGSIGSFYATLKRSGSGI